VADYTNFCCRNGGSNLNAGTATGDTTEPGTSSLVTYTGGDWNSGTEIYTAPVGADMTEAVVGRFASLYHDGDTAPTLNQFLVARISAVNAGTRQITLHATARMMFGSEVSTGTGNRSLRVGGAWAGPAGAAAFPFHTSASWGGLTNASSHTPRINLKNDATYTVSAALTAAGNHLTVQGYATSYGDGGRASLDGGTAGAAYVVLTLSGAGAWGVDLIVQNNGATSSAIGIQITGTQSTLLRVAAKDIRGAGIATTQAAATVIECWAEACNQSNTANTGGMTTSAGDVVYVRCFAVRNTGSNTRGIMISGGVGTLLNCVCAENGSHGAHLGGSSGGRSFGSDFYANGGSGLLIGVVSVLENNNFLDNTGTAINSTSNCLSHNSGFGTGTMANNGGSGDVTTPARTIEVGSVTYAADATPWSAPGSDDYSITLAAAKGAGRGTFAKDEAGANSTTGYPDIGAAQHQESTTVLAFAVAQPVSVGGPGSGNAAY
jgi:hypothetical protein